MPYTPLTPEEIQRRFAEINAREPEDPTPEDLAAFAEAEAMDDGRTVTLEEFERELCAFWQPPIQNPNTERSKP